jgi:hypothetical protein
MHPRCDSEAGLSGIVAALALAVLVVTIVSGARTVVPPLVSGGAKCELKKLVPLDPADGPCGDAPLLHLASEPGDAELTRGSRPRPKPPPFRVEHLDRLAGGADQEAAMLEQLTLFLNEFWFDRFPAEYSPPTDVLVTGDPQARSEQRYLRLRIALAEARRIGRGPGAAALVLAHEWGHLVQKLLRGGLMPGGPDVERHADCLAGVALRAAQRAGSLGEDRFREAVTGIAWSDHPDDSPTHGSGAERRRAFETGLTWTPGDDVLQLCGPVPEGSSRPDSIISPR